MENCNAIIHTNVCMFSCYGRLWRSLMSWHVMTNYNVHDDTLRVWTKSKHWRFFTVAKPALAEPQVELTRKVFEHKEQVMTNPEVTRDSKNLCTENSSSWENDLTRAASVVGIPTISRYTDFFQNSVFLEAKGGALLYLQKSVKLGIFAKKILKRG